MRFATLSIPLLATVLLARATTTLPITEEEEWRAADGALRGRVEAVTCSASPVTGRPVTKAVILVEETLRGKLPARITLTYPGGTVAGQGEDSGDYPALRVGEERLFFVSRKGGKTLGLSRGGLSVKKITRSADGTRAFDEVLRERRLQRLQKTDPTAPVDLTPFAAEAPAPAQGANVAANGAPGSIDKSGLILDSISTLPARWLAPDRGEPIPYIVDATVLPVGVTLPQALTAVSNALAAWTAVTGMTFRYDGTQDFHTGADDVLTTDEKIRIQLHDAHASIEESGAIAIGGRGWSSTDSLLDNTGGGGGQVAGLEFHKATRGYIVLRHTVSQLSNLKTLEEVLCHELGHVFGLAHSSENPAEADTTLREAVMYYKVHTDSRGAVLGSYDVPAIQKAHPLNDTPPWAYARYMTAHTGSKPQTAAGVNEYTVTGYDRQTSSEYLTLTTGSAAGLSQGTFAFTGNKVKFTPGNSWTDGGIGDPLTAFYAKVLYRFGDGVNCSPWQPVSVIAYRQDNYPDSAGVFGDGMPDNWMKQYWVTANPADGPKRGPNDDYDNDGYSNLEEYRLGTNPTRSQSKFDFNSIQTTPGYLTWPAKPWNLYSLERSADGVTWEFWKAAVAPAPSGSTALISTSIWAPADPDQPRRLLRMRQMQ